MFLRPYLLTNVTRYSNFSTTSKVYKSHYDSLGITPKATQTDVKSAYYKLSMRYHPDKNKGSHDASKKFQDITAAYEILGNFKLRKLYDKGILHTATNQFGQEIVVEEHPEHKFYKSRQTRHDAPTMTGRTPIYNFDEWSRAHYGATFERSNRAKERFTAKKARLEQDAYDIKNELTMSMILAIFFLGLIISYVRDTTVGYDNVKLSENIEKKTNKR